MKKCSMKISKSDLESISNILQTGNKFILAVHDDTIIPAKDIDDVELTIEPYGYFGIELNEIESAFVLACKGWYINDNYVNKEDKNKVKNFSYEEFIKNYINNNNIAKVSDTQLEEIRTISQYPPILLAYLTIYGNDIDFDTYPDLINILSDLAFKINPSHFKNAVLENYGQQAMTSNNFLSSLRSVINQTNAGEIKFCGKYIPLEFSDKYPESIYNI